MKKLVSVLLVALLAISLAACSNQGGNSSQGSSQGSESSEGFDLSTLKTLGDLYQIDPEHCDYGMSETRIAMVLHTEDLAIRGRADVSAQQNEAIDAIDFFAEDRDDQMLEIFKDIPFTSVEDLSKGIPSEEEINAFVGKTGQDLLDAGFGGGSGYMMGGGEYEFYLSQGDYEYVVIFNDVTEVPDEQSVEEFIVPLTVKSITYFGISQNASDPD